MFKYQSFNSMNRRVVTKTSDEQLPFETRATYLQYRKEGSSKWEEVSGQAMTVPDTNRIVHTIELSDLESDQGYEFKTIKGNVPAIYLTWKDDPSTTIVVHYHTLKPIINYTKSYSTEIYKFKTMPTTLSNKVRVAQVTDTHGQIGSKEVFKHIGLQDVDVIIHSGDMATGNGGARSPDTWYTFYECLNHAVDTNGYIIPLLANLGNHEAWEGGTGMEDSGPEYGNKPDFDNQVRGDTEWYYAFNPAFPGLQGYGELTFGDYMSIMQLDPGISTLRQGAQLVWLEAKMIETENIPHKLISYHYSPYPPGRRPLFGNHRDVRDYWVPAYEDYDPLVMVGHDHVWSITEPIYQNQINEEKGIVTIGAGPSQTNTEARSGRNPHTKWWLKDTRATEWKYYNESPETTNTAYFERPDYNGIYSESRQPHELDGTTFTQEEVNNWWLIEIEYGKRTMTAFDGNKNAFYTFTQNV